MIAKKISPFLMSFLGVRKQFWDAHTIGSAVYVITEENRLKFIFLGILNCSLGSFQYSMDISKGDYSIIGCH